MGESLSEQEVERPTFAATSWPVRTNTNSKEEA